MFSGWIRECLVSHAFSPYIPLLERLWPDMVTAVLASKWGFPLLSSAFLLRHGHASPSPRLFAGVSVESRALLFNRMECTEILSPNSPHVWRVGLLQLAPPALGPHPSGARPRFLSASGAPGLSASSFPQAETLHFPQQTWFSDWKMDLEIKV